MFRKALMAAACAAACATPAKAAPPIAAFAHLPAMEHPHLSPDGTHIAFVRDYNGKSAAAVIDLRSGSLRQTVLPSDKWNIYNVRWASNTRLILFAGTTQRFAQTGRDLFEVGRAIAIDPDGSNAIGLLGNNDFVGYNTNSARITDITLEEPQYVYMPLFTVGAGYSVSSALYQVDLYSGKGTIAIQAPAEAVGWIMDGHGAIVARVDQSERPIAKEKLMLFKDGAWNEALSADIENGEGLGVIGLSGDGKSIAHWKRTEDGRLVMGFYDMATGSDRKFFGRPNYDMSAAWFDDWTERVIGAVWTDDQMEAAFYDPEVQGIQLSIQDSYPGHSVVLQSMSTDRQTVLAMIESPREPTAYVLVHPATGAAQLIGRAYPDLPAEELGDMRPWPYKARDGLDIPAYLTLPPGKSPKNLPLIVMPHGGPDARDYLHFDWWAQFLASRGYAVLQPNYRGSSGYGAAFTAAGFQQWGLKMQDDITDGVKKAIADGIADPSRICIVGASYGGYAALAGATLTPDLYACAVSVAGVSDLPKMLVQYDRNSLAGRFWLSRIGELTSAQLRATSPARLVANVKCPILLMHGKRDTTVPIEQSELMMRALQAAGKPVTMVTFEDDDHYLQLADTRQAMLTHLEQFLAGTIGR